jgi:hypothetical protein
MTAPQPRRDGHRSTTAGFVLPVSRLRVALAEPTGAVELLLAESDAADPALGLAIAQQLGQAEGDVDWSALAVHDIDTLVVRLRQTLVGDQVVADTVCPTADCGRRVDLSFGLDAYLAYHRPRSARGRGWSAKPCAETPGWYSLEADGAEVARFRLPNVSDQIAVGGVTDEAGALAARCILAAEAPARVRRRVNVAMESLAPPLAGPLQGRCPDCEGRIDAWFDARLYCLQGLCARARFVFDDVALLAEHYHWSEKAILNLPLTRRERYAERARLARAS